MIRIACLHQNLAGPLAPARTPRYLRQHGEEPFCGPVVARDESSGGVQHGGPRQAGEDVALAAAQCFERSDKLAAPARAVAVDAHDARAREACLQRFLDALRAASQGPQIEIAAGRANAWHPSLGAAMVAAQ